MKYTCSIYNENAGKTDRWDGFLYVVSKNGPFTEFVINGRGSSMHGVVGPEGNGHFLCLPGYGVGSELADYADVNWNLEQLSGKIGIVDAVTLVTGLKYLKTIA